MMPKVQITTCENTTAKCATEAVYYFMENNSKRPLDERKSEMLIRVDSGTLVNVIEDTEFSIKNLCDRTFQVSYLPD